MKLLTRKGFLIEEQGMSYLDDSDPDRALGPLRAAACTYRIALGPRAGQKVPTLQTVPSRAAPPTQQRCVNAQGFSLHAEVCCAADQRKKLEHLCRYITRPAIANERLTLNRAGDVVLQLKSPYHDGTTHVVMSPLGVYATPGRACPPSTLASDPLSWRARAQRYTAARDHSLLRAPSRRSPWAWLPERAGQHQYPLSRPRRGAPCRGAGAHELGPVAEAGVRD